MAAVNRCQGFYWLRIYHLTDGAICAPPQKVAYQDGFKKSLIFSAIALSLISTNSLALDFVYHGTDPGKNPEINTVLLINDDSDIAEYENIDISLNPPIANGRYTVYVDNGQNLKVSGKTTITLEANRYVDVRDNGTNALYATGAETSIDLDGDVSITTVHNVDGEDSGKTVGANAVYANYGATINLGSQGKKTVIWAIGEKPDAVSAKNGASVVFESTHNQLIGSIDLTTRETSQNTVSGTFSGSDSFWFGDEQSFSNGFAKDNGGRFVVAIFGRAANLDLTID